MLPGSSQVRKKAVKDHDKNEEIKWLKDLIWKLGKEKPNITEFSNKEQRVIYKQYAIFQLVYKILYRQAEDQFGHPQCDGQREKSVQQIKKMIRAQLCFAYNTSVHETTGLTPLEVMFGRNPIIPIDLVYPNRIEITREKVLENHTVPCSALGPVIIDSTEKFDQVEILQDIDTADIELKCPVQLYIAEKRNRLQTSYTLLERHRLLKMIRAQKNYNRRIKKQVMISEI